MKRFLTIALAAASIGLFAGTASAAVNTYNTGDAANGIGNSRHNLGSFGEHVIFGQNYNTVGDMKGVMSGTTEICIFCHTPHHANTTNETAPLWNKNRGTQTYTAYGATIGGTTIANGDIGSTTLACLGCHDGTTQFDNIVNKPGKGGVNGTDGSGADGTGADAGWSVFEDGGTISQFMTSTRLNIGTNLSNDHPVSIAYPAVAAGSTGIASLRSTDTVISTINLLAGLSESATTYDGGNLTKNFWAVKGFVNGAAKISDLLRGTGNKVECSSCHDPHFNNKSWNEIDVTYQKTGVAKTADEVETESNGLFLRRVGGNTGSGLCRTCHNK